MARRRYLSTNISTDAKINQLSDQAALLYTWAIPHFADDCRLTPQNAVEIKLAIVPGRSWNIKHIEGLINEVLAAGLWGRDENDDIFIPSESFYKFQTYVNAANRRETPQIAASFSSSSSSSSSLKEEEDKRPPLVAFALPDWINKQTWEGFEEVRKKLRHPMTNRARQLIVKQLEKFKSHGHDPNLCLETSIRKGWRDVFEPDHNGMQPIKSRLEIEQDARRKQTEEMLTRGMTEDEKRDFQSKFHRLG